LVLQHVHVVKHAAPAILAAGPGCWLGLIAPDRHPFATQTQANARRRERERERERFGRCGKVAPPKKRTKKKWAIPKQRISVTGCANDWGWTYRFKDGGEFTTTLMPSNGGRRREANRKIVGQKKVRRCVPARPITISPNGSHEGTRGKGRTLKLDRGCRCRQRQSAQHSNGHLRKIIEIMSRISDIKYGGRASHPLLSHRNPKYYEPGPTRSS